MTRKKQEHGEPIWVPRLVVEAVHFDQLQEHGGERGMRDDGALLDAALGRPRNKFAYDQDSDFADLAAAYAFAIARSCHPFNDGNKRTAFVVASIFLDLNGQTVNVSDENAVKTMLAVADGTMSEKRLAEWFRRSI